MKLFVSDLGLFLPKRYNKYYEVIYSLPYADYTENGEELFINIKPENDTCFYMAAKLWTKFILVKNFNVFSINFVDISYLI